MAAVKRLLVLHYCVVYILGSFVINDPIPALLNIYMRVNDEALLAESSRTGTENFDTSDIFILICVFITLKGYSLHNIVTKKNNLQKIDNIM